ncbi:carboxypeptidase-like regulatory domain-containing protein [Parabacteroides goldsteinii]|nr:carboxypeptidase-like regulatory domain-containing protein [Parabacteroides goldsteinii]
MSGIVKDINGEPLFGVNVSVKGSTTGTITDEEGAYSFANLNPKDILVFSYLGMLSQEVTIGSRTEINIVMAEDVIGLEDVVVTGYTSMKRKDITGSVASISSEKIGRIPANDITTSLVGVPGIRMDGSSI